MGKQKYVLELYRVETLMNVMFLYSEQRMVRLVVFMNHKINTISSYLCS